jgi:hypothetical protein
MTTMSFISYLCGGTAREMAILDAFSGYTGFHICLNIHRHSGSFTLRERRRRSFGKNLGDGAGAA